MKDYSAMSDFEISHAVARAIDFNLPNPSSLLYNKTGKWELFEPCENPADAWPIILDNKINIDHRESIKSGAMASQSGRKEIYAVDKNPLRAAMIVFLMMKDEEVNTQGEKL